MIADELIGDYRNPSEDDAFMAAMATLASWKGTAAAKGDEFLENDWIALVLELARQKAAQDD
jgi:hypothetical protein